MAVPTNPLLDSLSELRNAISQESCVPKEPFIKLGTGQAPVLNYNIPQTACFTTYGHQLAKGIGQEVFIAATKVAPTNNYFARVAEMPEETIRQEYSEAIQLQRTDNNLVIGAPLLRKNIDAQASDLQAVAFDTNRVVAAVEGQPQTLTAFTVDRANATNEVQYARLAKQGVQPMVMEKLGGYETRTKFIEAPPAVVPYFAIIEEYTTCSYLGDYGAGRTIKTFSLLPGEKTTITVKTYKDISSTRAYSENVLDSFSQASTDELEKNIEYETGMSDSTTTGTSNTNGKTRSGNVGGNVGVSLFGIVNIGVQGGYTGGSASSDTNTTAATRASNVRAVNKALNKHVSTSNANRQIDVNTTTTDSVKEGEESSTVRELVNYNKSRGLNFVFRQLLQQYITVTYLSNVRFAFCNGYQESLRVVELEELDKLLEDTVLTQFIEPTRQKLLKHYCNIFNYEDEIIPFVEQISYALGDCVGLNETETFHRIRRGIEDTYLAGAGGLEITVKGPILSVATHTLKTSSVVVDALLGQGEALDCYNQKAQDAESIKGYIANLTALQQIELIEGITDPTQKLELYKKVFGACCDVPQTQIIP